MGVCALMMALAALLAGCSGNSAFFEKDDVNYGTLTKAEALETLDAYLSKINVTENKPILDISSGETIAEADEIPDIGNYPLSVEGGGEIDVEIFSSTEKAGSGKDGWINEVAADFNRRGYEVDGQSVSVSIRPIASGLTLDYIVTGKHVPDAFSPANALWAKMIEDGGVRITEVTDRLCGNTAGILMEKSVYKEFTAAHGDVTLENVTDAVLDGEIILGYTNPYASSTGLNMLTATLKAFDPENPLSEKAAGTLREFQAQVPPVAFTTAQMRESAKKGLVDVMIMEYQAYINEPTLADYVFTPIGVRHDSPVYVFEGTTDTKRQALNLFVDYCMEKDAQELAGDYGFNAHEDYAGQDPGMSGAQLLAAQSIWKENKSGGKPAMAVFVADVSGSMEGTPITELKRSLRNASQYIGDGNLIGLISYANDVYVDLPIAEFSGKQPAYFNGAVTNLSAGGGTATYDAVLVALKMLLDKKEEVPDARLMIFVLSDGEANEGFTFEKMAPVAAALGIPLHTIGYNANLEELSRMSAINEGLSINANESNVVYQIKNVFNANL
jgi:Ca-activated chloride channel family protein